MSANSKHFYFDYKDGKYGYNTNPNRGADTFVPFKDFGNLQFESASKSLVVGNYIVSNAIFYNTKELGTPPYLTCSFSEENGGTCKLLASTEVAHDSRMLLYSRLYFITVNKGTATISDAVNGRYISNIMSIQ